MNPFQYIRRLYNRHQVIQMLPFQGIQTSIQDLEDMRVHKHRHHPMFPFLMALTILIDTGIQYYRYFNEPDFEVFHRTIMREFVPKIFMRQAAIIFTTIDLFIIFCNLFLILDKFPHLDFILLSTSDNQLPVQMTMPYRKEALKNVPDQLSAKLMKFYEPFQRRTRFYMWLMSVECDFAFLIPLTIMNTYKSYSSNWEYFPSCRILLYALVCLVYFRALVHVFGIGLQFICTNGLIQIRQQFYLSKMRIREPKFIMSFSNVQKKFRNACRSMEKILDLTRTIEKFGKFFNRYVTVLIVLFGVAGCSALHAVVQKASEAPVYQTVPWACYAVCYLTFIFLFNVASSRTIYLNFRLFKQLRQLQIQVLSGRNLISRLQIVKLDLVNEYKILLQKCGFRMLNSAMINNKLFVFQIFGCVSVFYLKLVREEPVE